MAAKNKKKKLNPRHRGAYRPPSGTKGNNGSRCKGVLFYNGGDRQEEKKEIDIELSLINHD